MEEWLIAISKPAIAIIDMVALLAIAFGTIEAFVSGAKFAFANKHDRLERIEIWLRFSRWLVAGLTFQLAADIIESSITTSWTSVGRLAAVAVIRTFLNYFLERDLKELRERKRAGEEPSPA